MSSLDYLNQIWDQSHKKLKNNSSYRKLFPHYTKDGINFSSNDYLSLRQDSRLSEAGFRATKISGAGSGASRSVLQTDSLIENLEGYFCEETGFKSAIFLPSGFIANLTFFDVISPFQFEEISQELFVDHRCHASLFFLLKNNDVSSVVFRHNDMAHLEKKLMHSQAKAKIIIIESLFSMDGDFLKAEELEKLCEKYKAAIFIDESHSFGIFGKNGAGWIQNHPKLKKYLLAASFGCGKAVGVCGGFFATNLPALKERVLQKSRLFIYSTGLSPFISGAVYESLKIIFSKEGEERREALFKNIDYFLKKIEEINFNFPFVKERNYFSQIFPLIFYSNEATLKISNYLMENKILAKAMRPPSVPNHTSRLRICLTSNHTEKDIDLFISTLNKGLKEFL